MPTTSPCETLKEMSRSAQRISFGGRRRNGARSKCTRWSRSWVSCWSAPSSYRLQRFSTVIDSVMTSARYSYDIRKYALSAPEMQAANQQQQKCYHPRAYHELPIDRADAKQAAAEPLDDAGHRIQREQPLIPMREKADRIDYRSHEQSNLGKEWNGVLHITVSHV